MTEEPTPTAGDVEAPNANSPSSEPSPAVNAAATNANRPKKWKISLGVVVLAIVAVAIALGVTLGGNNDAPTSVNSNNNAGETKEDVDSSTTTVGGENAVSESIDSNNAGKTEYIDSSSYPSVGKDSSTSVVTSNNAGETEYVNSSPTASELSHEGSHCHHRGKSVKRASITQLVFNMNIASDVCILRFVVESLGARRYHDGPVELDSNITALSPALPSTPTKTNTATRVNNSNETSISGIQGDSIP